jgi:tyrosyl-tRNA synthetase
MSAPVVRQAGGSVLRMADIQEQLDVLTAGAAHVIERQELKAKLRQGRPLNVKLGIDPTASDIHLGFAVVLHKLRQFQDFGHRAVLIIGDFTAQIGDPSGRSKTRPRLSKEAVNEYAQTYLEQAKRVLRFDGDLIYIADNSHWLGVLDMQKIIELASNFTVARILERDDFTQRQRRGDPISLTELLYPLLQAYDSVQVEADVELGGTDQLFNNLMGRDLQRAAGQQPQVVMTMPLLEGLDGKEKMSKSVGNYIGIAEPPAEQYGKLMKVPDELMPKYFQLTTGWHPDKVNEATNQLARGDLKPVDAKRLLARTVVGLYHGKAAAIRAEEEFDRVHKEHAAPSEVQDYVIPSDELRDGRIEVARLLTLAGLAASNREGRRKIGEGGVYLDDERVTDPSREVAPEEVDGRLLRLGRRSWARIRAR